MAVGADIPDIWIREEASVSQQVSVVLQNTYNQAIGIILNLSRWAQALFSEKALDALTKDEKSFLWLTRLIVSDAGPTRKLRILLSDLIGSNSQIDFSRLCLNYPDLISLEETFVSCFFVMVIKMMEMKNGADFSFCDISLARSYHDKMRRNEQR